MQPLRPESLHHAYIIEGNPVASLENLFAFLKKSFGVQPGHADLFISEPTNFGVDDTRVIVDANLRKPVLGDKKFIIAKFDSISQQAQNSLLKTLEEPYPGTHIFLVTQTASGFLPTVLSRVHVVSFDTKDNNGDNKEDKKVVQSSAKNNTGIEVFNPQELALKFISSKPVQRLEMVKTILADKEKELIGDADVERFIMEIEKVAHERIQNSDASSRGNSRAKQILTLKPLLVVDQYMRDTSSSFKLLLEYTALTLPVF